MWSRLRDGGFGAGLGFRLASMLSLAILPIGLISLTQTLNLSRSAERAVEQALLGRTAAAAAGERAILQTALGTVDALGDAAVALADDPEACHALMRSFLASQTIYSYAGMTPLDGQNRCNSSGKTVDFTTSPVFQKFLIVRGTLLAATQRGAVSGQSVVVIAQPVYRNDELYGYTSVSVSQDLLRSTHDSSMAGIVEDRIVTFDRTGDVLSSHEIGKIDTLTEMPIGAPLDELLANELRVLRAEGRDGVDRVYASVAIVPGLAHAVGIFTPEDTGVAGIALARLGAVLLPMALWGVSLAVAYLAVYRLVLRPIRELRGQMRRFAVGDRETLPRVLSEAPAEIADVSRTFHNMARILVRDEQQLEEVVTEKTVLLKEVHHRVKNNLQLIASIINMQSRMIDDVDAKRVLRAVQDRVASLASIYRNLYQAEHLDSVEADQLVADIVDQMGGTGLPQQIRVTSDLVPLTLLPDQAVPLTLLATEALTNALKYASEAPTGGGAWVHVALTCDPQGRAVLSVENSLGDARVDNEGSGLGSQLIEAFALQLDADLQITQADGTYRMRVAFKVETPSVVALPDEDAERPVVLTSAARDGARH